MALKMKVFTTSCFTKKSSNSWEELGYREPEERNSVPGTAIEQSPVYVYCPLK